MFYYIVSDLSYLVYLLFVRSAACVVIPNNDILALLAHFIVA